MNQRLALTACLLVGLAACSSGSVATVPPTTATSATASVATTSAPEPVDPIGMPVLVEAPIQFTDDLSMTVFRPDAAGPWPTVVFFHGGSWYGGDAANVEPYARALAANGLVVLNATYRVGNFGGGFPQSYEDISCAIDAATDLAGRFGGTDDVVVAGYSAGAHLAATVVLADDAFAGANCVVAGRTGEVVGFVGVAGPYAAQRFGPLLAQWFGTEYPVDPSPWEAGSPTSYLSAASKLPVLLIHGDRDQVVQLGFSEEFAASLEDSGFEVTLEILADADHPGVIDPAGDGQTTAEMVGAFARRLLPGD